MDKILKKQKTNKHKIFKSSTKSYNIWYIPWVLGMINQENAIHVTVQYWKFSTCLRVAFPVQGTWFIGSVSNQLYFETSQWAPTTACKGIVKYQLYLLIYFFY